MLIRVPGSNERLWTVARLPLSLALDLATHAGMTGAGSSLRVLSFGSLRKGTLAGFVTIQLGAGFRLRDCTAHVHPGGRAWVSLPGKPLIGEDGRQKQDDRGRPSYVAIAEWNTRQVSDRFGEIIIRLLRQRGDVDEGVA